MIKICPPRKYVPQRDRCFGQPRGQSYPVNANFPLPVISSSKARGVFASGDGRLGKYSSTTGCSHAIMYGELIDLEIRGEGYRRQYEARLICHPCWTSLEALHPLVQALKSPCTQRARRRIQQSSRRTSRNYFKEFTASSSTSRETRLWPCLVPPGKR